MYNAAEFAEHYAEVTGNSPRPVVGTVSPDFEGFFKRAFEQIDNLMMEVGDVQSR